MKKGMTGLGERFARRLLVKIYAESPDLRPQLVKTLKGALRSSSSEYLNRPFTEEALITVLGYQLIDEDLDKELLQLAREYMRK